jgi:hypothetical protein
MCKQDCSLITLLFIAKEHNAHHTYRQEGILIVFVLSILH